MLLTFNMEMKDMQPVKMCVQSLMGTNAGLLNSKENNQSEASTSMIQIFLVKNFKTSWRHSEVLYKKKNTKKWKINFNITSIWYSK